MSSTTTSMSWSRLSAATGTTRGVFARSLAPMQASPYDRVLEDGGAMSASQKRGLLLFAGKAGCAACHWSPDLTSSEFLNTGLKPLPGVEDGGRFEVTHSSADSRAFRVP